MISQMSFADDMGRQLGVSTMIFQPLLLSVVNTSLGKDFTEAEHAVHASITMVSCAIWH